MDMAECKDDHLTLEQMLQVPHAFYGEPPAPSPAGRTTPAWPVSCSDRQRAVVILQVAILPLLQVWCTTKTSMKSCEWTCRPSVHLRVVNLNC